MYNLSTVLKLQWLFYRRSTVHHTKLAQESFYSGLRIQLKARELMVYNSPFSPDADALDSPLQHNLAALLLIIAAVTMKTTMSVPNLQDTGVSAPLLLYGFYSMPRLSHFCPSCRSFCHFGSLHIILEPKAPVDCRQKRPWRLMQWYNYKLQWGSAAATRDTECKH